MTPDVPHRFELELTVPGSPEDVWRAIASAEGISSWMMPTDLEPHVGGAVEFEMGPGQTSRGRVTAFEPPRRVEYEEDWASLVGHAGAPVTPLVTEFLVEATSGGSCIVRVVTSAFGTGAAWEDEFWADLTSGWAPVLDNLRLYLTHFPGQTANPFRASSTFVGSTAEEAFGAVRRAIGAEALGSTVDGFGVSGRVVRLLEHHLLLHVHEPVPGLVSLFAFGGDGDAVVHVQGFLFPDPAGADGAEAPGSWQRQLDELAASAGRGARP